MSKILKLPPHIKLWLSYTWNTNNHGICGHTFEVIDYYYILKRALGVEVGILLADATSLEEFKLAITRKYAFTVDELSDIIEHTVCANKPSLVVGTNILFTDGGVVNASKLTLIFDNILYFACGNKQVKDNKLDNVFILQDARVYEPVHTNGVHYVKKILFSKLRQYKQTRTDTALVYATKNCRQFNNYDDLLSYADKLLVITNQENMIPNTNRIQCVIPPVDNLFDKFDIYVYTPTPRMWDCSPRLIAECAWYNKTVVYHNIDYWDLDKGLYWRVHDINTGLMQLDLQHDDSIIQIIQGIIC